jgi:sialidase-1
MHALVMTLALILGADTNAKASAPSATAVTMTEVFVAGEGDYHTYRIPAVVQTVEGTILAFCEGRRDSRSDTGQIDTVLKHSSDNGATWSELQVVSSQEGFTTGNPAPVVDRETGDIILLLTRNASTAHEKEILKGTAPRRTVWITRSQDDGLTWSAPREITDQASREDWRWYATGPVHGIQLKSGRLVIPCNHSLSPDVAEWHSHVIYSDDHGATWNVGGVHEGMTNESTVVELADGRVYQNMRNYRKTFQRASAVSTDQGETWQGFREETTLVEPVCQASVERYSTEAETGVNRILFSNPADKKRVNMTVRMSLDETQTWPIARTLWEGPSAYSDLVTLADGTIGCLFERGDEHPYEKITFARFPLAWLTDPS